MHYMYILYSFKQNNFYTGHSRDLGDRFIRHNKGLSKATRTGIPWILVYAERFRTRSEAVQRELKIKSMKSRKYIIELIEFDPTVKQNLDG